MPSHRWQPTAGDETAVDDTRSRWRLTPLRLRVYSRAMTAITLFAALFLSLTSLLLAKLLRPAR